jgi:tRNA (guanine6-N2)-methyltransferase
MKTPFTYWVRTAAGLEKIFLHELQQSFKVTGSDIKHKSVLFSLDDNTESDARLLSSLRTADDIYKYIGSCKGIDNTKISVVKITIFFDKYVLPIVMKAANAKFIRVTTSFLGRRNFSRFYVENALNAMLFTHTDIAVLSNEEEAPWKAGELRVRIHIEDDEAFFGIGLQDKPLHRRPWKVSSYTAQLHPPLAAAMAIIAKDLEPTKIIDPFCGSGTILIESSLQNSSIKHTGFDISKEAIDIAIENAALARTHIEFHQDDFYNHYTNAGDYCIVSNPPWGEKHSIEAGKENVFFEKLVAEISQSRGAVLLIPDELADKLTGIAFTKVLQTRVRGKLASVIVLNNGSSGQ